MLVKLYTLISLLLDCAFCLIFDVFKSPFCLLIVLGLFTGFYLGIIIIHLIIVAILTLLVNKNKPCEKPSALYRWFIDYTLEMFLYFARVNLQISGLDKIPEDKRFLMVSNHLSNLDPLVSIVAFMKFGIIYVSKPENFKLPFVGQFIHKSGFLAIDRENPRNAMRTIHKATDYVKDDIASVCIYPEGTRSKTGELLEFKDGVFYVCKKALCPVVVVTVKNTQKIAKNSPFKKTDVIINVVDVIYPEAFEESSTHELSESVRAMMIDDLK